MEFIFEAILEGVFGLTVKNPKLQLWIRTAVYLLMAETVAVLIGIGSVSTYRNGNTSGGIGTGVLAALLGIGFLLAGIYGHKRKWEQ